MALEDITNYVPLAEGLGTSGQPSREQFGEIAAAGYGTVINLALPTSDHAIADEGAVVTGHGMRFVHLPVEFAEPTVRDVKQFLGIMQAVQSDAVWVHCVVNLRVSAFCYHYLRVVRGVSDAEARSPMLDKWGPKMSDPWKEILALTAEELT